MYLVYLFVNLFNNSCSLLTNQIALTIELYTKARAFLFLHLKYIIHLLNPNIVTAPSSKNGFKSAEFDLSSATLIFQISPTQEHANLN